MARAGPCRNRERTGHPGGARPGCVEDATNRDEGNCEDLVQREFTATSPNQLWCTGITEPPTKESKVYFCSVIYVYCEKIVGWLIDIRQTTNLILNA